MSLKIVKFLLEKLRASMNLGVGSGTIDLIVWITGKWSDIYEIRIEEFRSDWIALVIIWSIRVADFGVHLVGLVIICRRPNEKSKST